MLSKGSVATLPIILLAIAWWQRGRISWRDVARTVPYFLVATVLTVVNIRFQTQGSFSALRSASGLERLLGAGGVVWFYFAKALLPIDLSFVYPRWQISASDWNWWIPVAAAAAVTVVLLWRYGKEWCRALLLAWIFFGAAPSPAMGFADVGFMKYSLVADHYQYLAPSP